MFQLDWKLSPADPDLAYTDGCERGGVPWTMGVRTTKQVPQPLRCELDQTAGRKMPDIMWTDVPLFSNRLIEAIRSTGVDNFECYDVEIHGFDGATFTDYKAVNIVGAIRCANLEASKYVTAPGAVKMDFPELVLDRNKLRDHEFFRLAENPLIVLVSDRIAEAIKKIEPVGLTLVPIAVA